MKFYDPQIKLSESTITKIQEGSQMIVRLIGIIILAVAFDVFVMKLMTEDIKARQTRSTVMPIGVEN